MSKSIGRTKPKRCARTTPDQYLLYVETLELDNVFLTGKSVAGDAPKRNEAVWAELTDALNASGLGPMKNIDGWKKVFSEWKSSVKKKSRCIQAENGEYDTQLKLTALEQRLLAVVKTKESKCVENPALQQTQPVTPIFGESIERPPKKRKSQHQDHIKVDFKGKPKSVISELNKINSSINRLTDTAADISKQLKISNQIALLKLKKQYGDDVELELDL